MRYSDMAARTVSLTDEATVLDGKKRLGSRQKARRTAIADELSLMTQSQPPATVRKPNTGERADHQGNVYANHSGKAPTLREIRRANNSGRGQIQHMRSRIQRGTRRQRTGGVR